MVPTNNINTSNSKIGIWVGRILSVLTVTGAILLGLVVVHHTNSYPRTDDSEIVANFIGIAPQVEGPILRLNVHDNQLVKQGELLYEIDDRPYQYALERAVSDQATLEGQIVDEQRRIAALSTTPRTLPVLVSVSVVIRIPCYRNNTSQRAKLNRAIRLG